MTSVTFSGSGELSQTIVNNGLGSATIVSIEGYSSIGPGAFYNKTQITSITISNSVTSIGSQAFEGCTSLTSVTFEPTSQVTLIGYSAFQLCSSLTSITIPNSVISIGSIAFQLSGLTTVNISAATAAVLDIAEPPATNIDFFGKSGVNTVLPPPTITNFSIPASTYGVSPFQITDPSSNSDGSFNYTSSNLLVATISGSTITVVGGGITTITATQEATTNYSSGIITTTFLVNLATPTITNFSIPASTYGAVPFQITDPSSNSDGSFNYTSSNTSVATISGSTITVVGGGITTITATQEATTNYTSGSTTTTFLVTQATTTITNFSLPTKTYGAVPFQITDPSSNSDGSFSYTSSNLLVATISGSTITVVGGGITTITATQEATTNYTSGSTTTTFQVNQATPTIATFSIPHATFNDSPFTIPVPSSTSNGSFSYTSSNTSVATISGSTINIIGGGITTITATQAATTDYTSGSTTTTFQVNPYINNVYISSNNYKNIYISGLHFVEGTKVLFTGSSVPVASLYTVIVMSSTSLKVTMDSEYEIETVTVEDINGNRSNIYQINPDLISNICFIAGTPITTDQGNIPIEKIDSSIHTIRNKKIVAITKTVTQDKYLVCFEKDSLGKNIPSQQTIISKNHKLFYNGKMRMAKEFLKDFANVENVVVKVKYTGSALYNVLLEEHDKMMVNNLICETLDPENGVAKVYMALQNLDTEGQKSLIKKINAHVIKNDAFNNKKISK